MTYFKKTSPIIAGISLLTATGISLAAEEKITAAPTLAETAQTLTLASWFVEKCNGITGDNLMERMKEAGKNDTKTFDVAYQNTRRELALKWSRSDKEEQNSMCLKSLIMFGPNGTTAKGLLGATPELQETLPVDIRKELGF